MTKANHSVGNEGKEGLTLTYKAEYVAELASVAAMHEVGFGATEDPATAGPTRYGDMISKVTTLTLGDPSDCDAAIASVQPLAPSMGSSFFENFEADINYMRDHMGTDIWTGASANDFRKFLSQFNPIAERQAAMAEELLAAAEGWRAALTETWHNTYDALDMTADALNKVIADAEAGSDKLQVSVIKIVIGIVGTLATAGSGVGLAFSAINTAFSVGDAIEASEKAVGGGTVDTIMSNLSSALVEIQSQKDTVEDDLIKVLGEDYRLIAQGENTPTQVQSPEDARMVFELPRPAIAG